VTKRTGKTKRQPGKATSRTPAKSPAGKRRPTATTKAKAKAKSKAASPRRPVRARASPTLMAPPAAGVELFDLVCSVEHVLERGLTFGVCQLKAQAHNASRPDHDAQPIRQQS